MRMQANAIPCLAVGLKIQRVNLTQICHIWGHPKPIPMSGNAKADLSFLIAT